MSITDARGPGLPGALIVTDANGVTSVDGRHTTNLPAFKGTDYQRPEDLQTRRVRGRKYLYVATTPTNEVYRLDLRAQTISVFANRATLDLATGLAVGTGLSSPDNLAVDSRGNRSLAFPHPVHWNPSSGLRSRHAPDIAPTFRAARGGPTAWPLLHCPRSPRPDSPPWSRPRPPPRSTR